jgi:hypothetical protein
MGKRPLSHVSPGLVSSPMPPPLPTPSFGWLLCIIIEWRPPKPGAPPISQFFDGMEGRARAALGDDDAAVNLDCDVNDVTRPVLVTTINTTDGNAASRDSEMVGWGDNRRATGRLRGNAGAMTTTPMGGPGDDDVEAVGRFRRAGRR